MKHLQFIGLIAFAAFLASCASTNMASHDSNGGNQEFKRLAALEQQRQQEAQIDEGQQNLEAAQQNIMNRDGNPARRY